MRKSERAASEMTTQENRPYQEHRDCWALRGRVRNLRPACPGKDRLAWWRILGVLSIAGVFSIVGLGLLGDGLIWFMRLSLNPLATIPSHCLRYAHATLLRRLALATTAQSPYEVTKLNKRRAKQHPPPRITATQVFAHYRHHSTKEKTENLHDRREQFDFEDYSTDSLHMPAFRQSKNRKQRKPPPE